MKKPGLILFLGMTLCCLMLSSCGVPTPPREKEIAKSIPEDIRTVIIENPFSGTYSDTYDMEVKSVTIEKRQTNGKEDIVYCIVELENDYYKFEKYVALNYAYYDKGGWILDDYSEYDSATWEMKDCPFSGEDVATLLSKHNIVDIDDPTIDTDSNSAVFSFETKDEYENVVSEGTIMVYLHFDGSGWTYNINTDDIDYNWDILGHWYSPIYGGLYLDINEMNDEYASVEMIYEDTAEDALAGKKGPLIDVSDEKYWHSKTQSTSMSEEVDSNGEPYLYIKIHFRAWDDTWNICIYRDSATAQVRMYNPTEMYRVESNPFIPDAS